MSFGAIMGVTIRIPGMLIIIIEAIKASRSIILVGIAVCIGWTPLGASTQTKQADVEMGRH
jgi:hypothetical protein